MSETLTVPVWINGQAEDRLPVSDRGLSYGDGLFETIRITPNHPVLLDYHLDRLMDGCRVLGLSVARDRIMSQLISYPGFKLPGILKLILTRGTGGRGYSPEGSNAPVLVLQHFPLPLYLSDWFERGIALFPCRQVLGHSPALAGIKHLNRLEQVLARAEWQGNTQFQEGLVCDINGAAIEGTVSNLFVVTEGRIETPRLDQCGIAGVMRRWLMEQFQRMGLSVNETTITLDSFRVADERFFCNSVYGVWPVARFQNNCWTRGPITEMAQQLIRSHWF